MHGYLEHMDMNEKFSVDKRGGHHIEYCGIRKNSITSV